jgi:deoxyribose-phosphate aldolase
MATHELAPFIDHSCLSPEAVVGDIERTCDEALMYRFRGVVVPSGAVGHAKRRLMNTGIKVVCVVGFPHGTQSPDIKAHEAMRAAAMGADEIDYVISIGAALEADMRFVREEGIAIIRQTRGKLVKAILETGFLPEEHKYHAARSLAEAGVHYVKTCTGFGPSGCTVADVELLVRAVEGKALIKASGGIRDKKTAIAMLQAGAAVIGTSHGPAICT